MSLNMKKGTALAALSMTPLIDVVFLLLIFFLVATRFADEEREMDIKLPQASEARQPLSQPVKELEVAIDEQGTFYHDHRRLTEAELELVLFRAARKNPGRQSVRIRGDRSCPFQSAVTAVNLCEKAGIRKYTISIK